MVRAMPSPRRAAVVTGAASGIGAALTRALVARGMTVYAADIDPAVTATHSGVPGVVPCVVDVADRLQVESLLERVMAETGRLDLVFNNAGVVVGGDTDLMDEASWRRVVDVNLWGVVHGSQAAYRLMKRQGHGHIVNTSSSAGVMPVARSAAYAATKHAVVGLSTSLRAEARGTGVNVSVVLSGLVDTPIFDRATNMPGYDYARHIKRVPFPKLSPEGAALLILRGVERNREFIVYPTYNMVLTRAYRLMPSAMSPLINPLINRGGAR